MTTPCPDKSSDVKCDKATTATQVTVEVNAEESSDESDNSADDSSEEQTAPEVAPMPHPVPVIVPPVVGVVAPMALETAPMVRVRERRHHIGEGGKLTVDDLITLRNAGVDAKYIEQMRGAGLGDLTLDDLAEMGMQGVTPAYIKEMADAGYSHLTAREISELRAMGVNPAFVKSLADAGYAKLSVKELVRLKASGVDADFIRDNLERDRDNFLTRIRGPRAARSTATPPGPGAGRDAACADSRCFDRIHEHPRDLERSGQRRSRAPHCGTRSQRLGTHASPL